MDPSVVYNVQAGHIWDWRVPVDLFLGGAGVGAFLVSVYLSRRHGAQARRLAQTAAFIAPALVIIGLLFLFSKLGTKMHVYQALLNQAWTSLMWWGFLLQGLLVALGLLYAWMWRRPETDPGRSPLALVIAAVALLVGIYHGALLAVLTSHPLWANGSMVLMAVFAFASTGVAAVFIADRLRGGSPGATGEQAVVAYPLSRIMLWALALALLNFLAWWLGLAYGPLQARQALDAAAGSYGALFIWAGIVLGIVVPLVLLGLGSRRSAGEQPRVSMAMLTLACVLVLVGGFVLRFVVVLGGQVPLPVATL